MKLGQSPLQQKYRIFLHVVASLAAFPPTLAFYFMPCFSPISRSKFESHDGTTLGPNSEKITPPKRFPELNPSTSTLCLLSHFPGAELRDFPPPTPPSGCSIQFFAALVIVHKRGHPPDSKAAIKNHAIPSDQTPFLFYFYLVFGSPFRILWPPLRDATAESNAWSFKAQTLFLLAGAGDSLFSPPKRVRFFSPRTPFALQSVL